MKKAESIIQKNEKIVFYLLKMAFLNISFNLLDDFFMSYHSFRVQMKPAIDFQYGKSFAGFYRTYSCN